MEIGVVEPVAVVGEAGFGIVVFGGEPESVEFGGPTGEGEQVAVGVVGVEAVSKIQFRESVR